MPVPNNIVIPEHKIAAFCLTKAANSSIKVAILKALGLPTDNPHVRELLEYADKQKIAYLGEWFAFAVVRNPWARLVALWADKCRDKAHPLFERRGMGPYSDFNDFVKAVCERKDFDIHWVSQSECLLIDGQKVPDFIGKYERLEAEWRFIQGECLEKGLDLPDLTHENPSDHGPYRGYYSQESKDLVSQRYAQDIEVFGYAY